MKLITILVIFTLSPLTYSQDIKDKLQGDWVCTRIQDLAGNSGSGKFGESNEYLKFSFKNDILTIMEAPFDKGIDLTIKFGDDFFDTFPEAFDEIPERIYSVKKMDGDSLILRTKNEYYKTIDYHFHRQIKCLDELKNGNKILDNGIIFINRFKTSKDLQRAFRISEYRFPNDKGHLCPCPIFTDSDSPGFGSYLSANILYPKSFQTESVSDELIVCFDVTDEGATNIKIIKGLNDELDASVLKVIRGSGKKWRPLKIDGQTIKTTMKFHLVFLPASKESRDYFKTGVDYFHQGKYELADTFFTKQIKQYPYDRDALFNRAAIRLLHGDTCTYCKDLFAINNPFDIDKEALEKYLRLCSSSDTVCYYDKNFVVTDTKEFRYFEVIEHHKYISTDFITGKIYDTKHKYPVKGFYPYVPDHFTTNLIAIYKLADEGHKIYTFTGSLPLYPGDWEKHSEIIKNCTAFKLMKNDLKIPGAFLIYTYIIDKDGKAKDYKINSLYPEVDAEKLLKLLTQLYDEMPNFKPGKFRGEPVDFLMMGILKF